MSVSPASFERPRIGNSNTVFKSGPLLISSRGLGWKSWKKRWFVLTRTSLVFYRNDPSTPPRNGEVIMTLGGIDLNNSGSVVVREDKKLVTVLFPDGRDGRAFTLKAETAEDLHEWKVSLERALAQAPNAVLVMENNGIFRSDSHDTIEGPFCQWRTKCPVKSVVGRPILFALEDTDGSPSFLEKAIRFLEKYGIKIEGILRLSADIEEVYRRVEEYEQGKTEFGPHEDAHVIGDCVKHALRELPSSPVPASSCSSLLEAHRVNWKEAQVNAMRSEIHKALPEPNRRLLHRILKMMLTISSHAAENRMTRPAVAACMAPLLLRPFFVGDCELEDVPSANADHSALLLAAANAASNAQAIITTLLEEYENIFDDHNLQKRTSSAYSEAVMSGSEYASDEGNSDMKISGHHNAQNVRDLDSDRRQSGKFSGVGGYPINNLYNDKVTRNYDPRHESPKLTRVLAIKLDPESDSRTSTDSAISFNETWNTPREIIMDAPAEVLADEPQGSLGDILSSMDQQLTPNRSQINGGSAKKSTFWRRKKGTRTPSESIDSSEEELAILKLEKEKHELQQRIAKEARGNAILQASIQKKKQALHEQRLVLEQDVSRLHTQLKAERDLRADLEVGLIMSPGHISGSLGMDSKTMAELEEIALTEADVARLKQKFAELHHQLSQQHQHQYNTLSIAGDRYRSAAADPHSKYSNQDLDTTPNLYHHERKRTAEWLGLKLRNSEGQPSPPSSSGSLSFRKHIIESTNYSESRSTVASPSAPKAYLSASYSASPLGASELFDYPRTPSSTLIELTSQLDFFKERRAQLMEQLQSLDLNPGSSPLNFRYKPSTSAAS